MIKLRTLFAMLLGGTCIFSAAGAGPGAVEIAPGDPAIRYGGRFDMRDKAAPRCIWPACMITLKFTGTDIAVKFTDDGHNFWQAEIDGKPGAKIGLQAGTRSYPVASGLPQGEHIVTLTKATESIVGGTRFLGFELNAGAGVAALPPVSRRLEVVGDSISCGYGVEAAGPNEHFTPKTENAWEAYGAIAARTLGADYSCIAWSGRKMWPDDTIPEIYDRTLADDPSLKWDFTAWTPDAVVINLGTNDFGMARPEEGPWIEAYRKFIARVRKNYPKAAIYCATGPMLGDGAPMKPRSTLLGYVQKIVAAENAAGDANVRALDFGQQSASNGFGASGHPSRKTQEIMASQLVETLRRDLGWSSGK